MSVSFPRILRRLEALHACDLSERDELPSVVWEHNEDLRPHHGNAATAHYLNRIAAGKLDLKWNKWIPLNQFSNVLGAHDRSFLWPIQTLPRHASRQKS